jgi:hypothetical protein
MSGFLVNKSLLDPTVTQYAGGTATFTLPQSGSSNATEVFVGGVPQIAGVDFTVTGTTLTLTTSAPAGANFVCARQYFSDGITGTPGANTVATAAIQNDSVTGGKLNPALVAGDIIYADGTDTINRLAKGSALQTLQMNAGATAPNWTTVAAASSGLTAISNTDISAAATYDFTGFTAGSYENYEFWLQNLIPATDAVHLWARTSTDATNYDSGASDYDWMGSTAATSSTYKWKHYNLASSEIALTGDEASAANKVGSTGTESGISGVVRLFGPHATSFTHVHAQLFAHSANADPSDITYGGYRLSAADVDGFRIMFSSGSIESGTITAYGLANS